MRGYRWVDEAASFADTLRKVRNPSLPATI
jgi:hypothetical protein